MSARSLLQFQISYGERKIYEKLCNCSEELLLVYVDYEDSWRSTKLVFFTKTTTDQETGTVTITNYCPQVATVEQS